MALHQHDLVVPATAAGSLVRYDVFEVYELQTDNSS